MLKVCCRRTFPWRLIYVFPIAQPDQQARLCAYHRPTDPRAISLEPKGLHPGVPRQEGIEEARPCGTPFQRKRLLEGCLIDPVR